MLLFITQSYAGLIFGPDKGPQKDYLHYVFPRFILKLPDQRKACRKNGILFMGKCYSYGEWGGRLIAESGKINRDVVLLNQKAKANTLPFIIFGGEFKGIGWWPKRSNKPLYLFDQLSLEARNFRVNTLVNFNEDLFFEINYQFDQPLVLDAFVTWGNFKKTPFYWTTGLQYLPYGDFSKYDVEVNSLNKTIFRINQFASTLGYKRGPHHVQLFGAPEYRRYGIAYEHTKRVKQGKLTHGLAYISDITNGTLALQSLHARRAGLVGAVDYYAFYALDPFQFHLEVTSSLKPIENVNPLLAYNLEAQYRFMFLRKPNKLILSTSGLKDADKLNHNPNFNQLGIFTTQYVVSMKRAMFKHISLGLAGILGKKLEYQRQFAVNLIVKV